MNFNGQCYPTSNTWQGSLHLLCRSNQITFGKSFGKRRAHLLYSGYTLIRSLWFFGQPDEYVTISTLMQCQIDSSVLSHPHWRFCSPFLGMMVSINAAEHFIDLRASRNFVSICGSICSANIHLCAFNSRYPPSPVPRLDLPRPRV